MWVSWTLAYMGSFYVILEREAYARTAALICGILICLTYLIARYGGKSRRYAATVVAVAAGILAIHPAWTVRARGGDGGMMLESLSTVSLVIYAVLFLAHLYGANSRRWQFEDDPHYTRIARLELLTPLALVLAMTIGIAAVRLSLPDRRPCEIMMLSGALESYRMDHGRYPPDTGYGLPAGNRPPAHDPGSLWRCLVMQLHDERSGRTLGPYMRWDHEWMKPYDDPISGKSFVLVDPWGNPYSFVGDPKRVVHNKGAFDLFSAGPDGKTACDEPGAAPDLAYDGADNDGNGVIDDAAELGAAARNGDVGDDINNW